jgi:hypothetical protein
LGKEYLTAVEAVPERLRPNVPFVRRFAAQAVTDVETKPNVTTIKMEAYFDTVVFETPRSNVRTVAKQAHPNRGLGAVQLAVGVFFAGTAAYVARKGHVELPERERGTAYAFAGLAAFASLPFIALGAYMVLAPEKSQLLWSNPVRSRGSTPRRHSAGMISGY